MRTIALLLLAAAALAGDVPVEKLPKEVRDALQKRFPGARIVEASIDKFGAGGKPRAELTYELTCVLPDREIEVLVTADGKVLDEEFKVTPLLLARDDVREDLAVFRKSVEERFAYLDYGAVEIAPLLKDIERRAGKGMPRSALALELRKVMARFIDGHADVSGAPEGRAFLPFLVEAVGERFVAFREDRSGFVADGCPWIEEIDGRPMATWVQGIHVLIPQGSPSFRTREALRLLRQLDLCREVLGDRARDDLEVVLSDGTKRTKLRLGLAPRQPIYGPWPRERAPGIDGEVGYLPLPRMDDDAARRVREWMPRLRDAEGLVVDVRGNGGGTREALLALHPWLAGTRVASAAKHRRAFPRDHLDARFMERVDELSGDERKAAKAFLAAFKPEWEPPKAEFGEWHVLVLPAGADRYAGKVAVLMDDRCFSATDIFLGALKGLPNVTLVGRPSGGGSGFAQRFTLPRSGITVRCASMASFTPWGELYDLHGIAPDVAVEVSPSYFLEGGDDEMLARAREVVSR